MQDYSFDWRPCMQFMGIPSQMYPMTTMPEQQLEKMYPRIYFIIFPAVIHQCDMMDMNHGASHIPTQEEVDRMIDDIYKKVEGDVDATLTQESGEQQEERQLGFGGRRVLRGLVGILLLRELLRRRPLPYYGSPYYGGYGPGYVYGPWFGGGY